MSDSILDKYKMQVEIDKQNEDFSLPKDLCSAGQEVDENYKKEYQKRLNELRNDSNSMEKKYEEAMKKIRRITENELEEREMIKNCEISNIFVKRAYCPECGEELISKLPPMFNPFTQERQCIHECKCGVKYNLDYSYPRIVFVDKDNNEIFAHCE